MLLVRCDALEMSGHICVSLSTMRARPPFLPKVCISPNSHTCLANPRPLCGAKGR